MADSTIKIKTQIETKQAEVQLATLENRMQKTADKAAQLRESMRKMENAKVPTQEYAEIQKQIEKANAEFEKLLIKQHEMVKNGQVGTTAFNNIDDKIEELGNEIRYAEGELQDLVDTGKAFTLGKDSTEYTSMQSKLKDLEAEMDIQNQKHEILTMKQQKINTNYKEMGKQGKEAIRKVSEETKKGTGAIGKFGQRVKSIVVSLLVFNVIRKALNGIISGIKEGFSNMMENFAPLKAKVESLNAALLTLKNTLASAFQPIVSAVIPYIQRMVEWLTKAINMVGQFIAAIVGRKTYTKAVQQSAKAAGSSAKATKKEAKALDDAAKAAEGYLSPIDEINKFSKDGGTGITDIPEVDDGGAGGAGVTMFEEVPIDSKILDWLDQIKEKLQPIVDYVKELWDIFKQGFFDGLGDWKTRWEDIKENIASIKDSLIDIWTDPKVLAAADKWVKSIAYLFGSLVGSFASIGLTLADNLTGGIAKYLEQNKDRIKKYLVAMFEIGTEINEMWAGYFQNIAYVFEAFASDEGKQLTANIIGIFADAFMGATELAAKFSRDLVYAITKPLEDNKTAYRTALEGFLGILAEVSGTVKDAIDQTFDKLNQVYDEHIGPFFRSFTDGISEIVGTLLQFWNENLQPLLSEWATQFDELWNSHLQPFVDSWIEMFGSVMELMKALWEEVLQPFINWIANEILPIVLPVLDDLWNRAKQLFADISDLLTNVVNVFKGVIDLITALIRGDWQGAWDACKSIVSNIMDAIGNVIKTGVDLFKNTIKLFVDFVINTITEFAKKIWEGIANIFTGIKNRVSDFFTWVKEKIGSGLGMAKDAWDKGWENFTGKVKEVWDGIVEAIQGAIDTILGLIDDAKSKWNDLKSSFSSNFSFSAIGNIGSIGSSINIPSFKIPKFATGGVIPTGIGQHLAIVGDNKTETEVVSPLSTIRQAVTEALGNSSSGSTVVKLYLDGNQIAESVVNAGKVQQMATGQNMFAF